MTLAYEELWEAVTGVTPVKPSKLIFAPGKSSLPFLDSFGTSFDRFVLTSFSVEYKPSCGTMTNGAVVIGVDWDPGSSQITELGQVQTLLPRIRVPVWQTQSMTLPASRLMSRRFFFTSQSGGPPSQDLSDRAPFGLCVITTGAQGTVGEVWVRYSIRFDGPCTRPRSSPPLNVGGSWSDLSGQDPPLMRGARP